MGVKVWSSVLLALVSVSVSRSQFLSDIHRQHIGCFKDDLGKRDLPYQVHEDEFLGSVEACIKACALDYYMYAGVQNGNDCFCGSTYGQYGPERCRTPCSKNPKEVCGGNGTSSIYMTDIKVPGPLKNLTLKEFDMRSLNVAWEHPGGPSGFVESFHIYISLKQSYDPRNRRFSPRHLELSGSSSGTRIIGLHPGAEFNVSVAAASKDGIGPIITRMYWTEIGAPIVPDAPKFIQHDDHGHDDDGDHHDDDENEHNGEIHIQFSPPDRNPNGPISAFRVIVINETAEETQPAPENDSLTDYETAKRNSQDGSVRSWIAAEVDNKWFDYHDEFVVGDGRSYGNFVNYGPLPRGQDFHVTIGLVSTLNNITKVTYAKVSHDQHSAGNFIVFKFHSHDEDDHKGHDHDHYTIVDDRKKHSQNRNRHGEGVHRSEHDDGSTDGLTLGLIVAIILFSIVLVAIVLFYAFLRFSSGREPRGRSSQDRHELTATTPSFDMLESGNNMAFALDETSDGANASPMDRLRDHVWQIPRNFLELTHEVIGRGKFGSVIRGQVSKAPGAPQAAVVQVVPPQILERHEMHAMANDVDLVARTGGHENVLGLIGICEEKEALFVVLQENSSTLKQALLDSRALVHYPVYAEKNQRVSTMMEETLLEHMIGVARGMEHLANLKIFHRKLCARNISLVNGVAKISGLGIADYSKPGQELDLARWVAPEAIKSRQYSTKCDMWSYGVLLWEAATLGATPFPELKSRDVAGRVERGLRLPQTTGVSEDLYQIMLNCWMLDPDERPLFGEVLEQLGDLAHNGNLHLNYSIRSGYVYENFSNNLELM